MIPDEDELREAREALIRKLIHQGYLRSERVIEAMRKIPRHLFVPEDLILEAYDDRPLPIGHGQTISAPHMVAMMTELLEVEEGMRVLEIGAGSGYQAAILAELVGEEGKVFTIERIPELAEMARKNLEKVGLSDRVVVVVGDGSKGLPEHSPFDRILVTAAAPSIPDPLLDQLKDGGVIVIPVGDMYIQELVWARKSGDKLEKRYYGPCAFVPLIGEFGFKERL